MLVIVLSFITRSVFIRYLGISFLGIEGIFTNVLSMLSLAELGFGSAIVFKLYKPIEEDDRHRIQVLMKLYRNTYRVIGWVVVALGICLIPVLPHLVKDYYRFSELGLNAVVIFLIYLFNTASSYWFFSYKTAFVQATQKTYLLTILGYAVNVGSSICQILVLVFTQNFVWYIVVQVVFTILRNFLSALICDKRHPYLKEKTSDRVSKAELKEFFKDCSALFLYRVSNVVIGGSDYLVLSSMLGLNAAGLYTNYVSVKSSIQNLLSTFSSSIQASLGSIHAVGNLDWSRLLFRTVNFLTIWLYGIGAIALAILMNDFIYLWLGSDYIVTSWILNGNEISTPIALLIGIELFTTGQGYYCGSFRNATGLFQELKYRPIASIIVNLAVSILLVPYVGIAGCIIGTIVANLTTNLIVDPIILHKHVLKCSSLPYFLRNFLYKIVVIGAGLLTWWVCGLIPLEGIVGFIVRGCVCVIVPCCVFTACFFRTAEFRYLWNTAKTFLPHKPTDTKA